MPSYVSANAKYYKNSKSSGEIGHIQRAFAENKNAWDELTPYNFQSTSDLNSAYRRSFEESSKKNPYLKSEQANTYIDCCVNFSRDKMNALADKYGWDKVQHVMTRRLNDYMAEIEEKQGFKPVGWAFHADEGYIDKLTGEFKHNYHAHVVFLNYDEKTNKMPLRRKTKDDWGQFQDIAAECFQKMGFKRGISKEITGAEHLEKDEYIAKKQARQMQENNLLAKFSKQMEKLLDYFETNNKKRLRATENRLQNTADQMEEIDFDEGLEVMRKAKERAEQSSGERFRFEVPSSKNKPK